MTLLLLKIGDLNIVNVWPHERETVDSTPNTKLIINLLLWLRFTIKTIPLQNHNRFPRQGGTRRGKSLQGESVLWLSLDFFFEKSAHIN